MGCSHGTCTSWGDTHAPLCAPSFENTDIMVLRRPGGGKQPTSKRAGLWRHGTRPGYTGNKYARRKRVGGTDYSLESLVSSITDAKFDVSSKSLFYGIVAFMAIIFSYVVLEKMISLHNNKMIDTSAGEGFFNTRRAKVKLEVRCCLLDVPLCLFARSRRKRKEDDLL